MHHCMSLYTTVSYCALDGHSSVSLHTVYVVVHYCMLLAESSGGQNSCGGSVPIYQRTVWLSSGCKEL